MSVEPRCPYCSAAGLGKVITQKLGERATVIYCSGCGAIYGILPLASGKSTQSQPAKQPVKSSQVDKTPQEKLPSFVPHLIKPRERIKSNDEYVHSAALTASELALILKHVFNRPIQLTMAQAAYMTSQSTNNVVSPYCPKHWYRMVKLIIPEGIPNADKLLWACPEFRACGEWEWVDEKTSCPKCGYSMRRMIVPQNYAGAGQKIIVCQNCQHWEKS
jgi:ssDNA-binding Zn-finger/Zn-ribbon topoisomerase 1